MKKAIFIFLFLPVILTGQNYIITITPEGDGLFTVEMCDNSDESEPLECAKWTGKDTAWVQLWGLQRMEQAATRKNTLITQAFLADLNMKQTKNAIKAVVPFDYEAYAQTQYLSTYDGEYRFAVRGGDSFRVIVSGGNVTRKNNGNPVATITAESPNGFYLVLPDEEILLTQSGIRWQGNNLAGQIVTLKKL